VTSNHQRHRQRADGALLAGVCSGIARRLGWNAWALRALFVIGLFVQTIATGVVYLLLALVVPRLMPDAPTEEEGLASDELRSRSERIADLERRFREMESKGKP